MTCILPCQHLFLLKMKKNGMKNVGRINCRLCSEYFCDYVLDNIAQRQNCIASCTVATNIAPCHIAAKRTITKFLSTKEKFTFLRDYNFIYCYIPIQEFANYIVALRSLELVSVLFRSVKAYSRVLNYSLSSSRRSTFLLIHGNYLL